MGIIIIHAECLLLSKINKDLVWGNYFWGNYFWGVHKIGEGHYYNKSYILLEKSHFHILYTLSIIFPTSFRAKSILKHQVDSNKEKNESRREKGQWFWQEHMYIYLAEYLVKYLNKYLAKYSTKWFYKKCLYKDKNHMC